jgi:hypothetical protein
LSFRRKIFPVMLCVSLCRLVVSNQSIAIRLRRSFRYRQREMQRLSGD